MGNWAPTNCLPNLRTPSQSQTLQMMQIYNSNNLFWSFLSVEKTLLSSSKLRRLCPSCRFNNVLKRPSKTEVFWAGPRHDKSMITQPLHLWCKIETKLQDIFQHSSLPPPPPPSSKPIKGSLMILFSHFQILMFSFRSSAWVFDIFHSLLSRHCNKTCIFQGKCQIFANAEESKLERWFEILSITSISSQYCISPSGNMKGLSRGSEWMENDRSVQL